MAAEAGTSYTEGMQGTYLLPASALWMHASLPIIWRVSRLCYTYRRLFSIDIYFTHYLTAANKRAHDDMGDELGMRDKIFGNCILVMMFQTSSPCRAEGRGRKTANCQGYRTAFSYVGCAKP